jgi:hypothetical protein
MMATSVAAIAVIGTSVAAGSHAGAATTAGVWHCSGVKISRCIEKVATDKVRVNFVNHNYTAVKGHFGVTCQGVAGQEVFTLKTNLTARGGYLSGTITCPSGVRDSAVGWQVTADTYYSPRVSI